VIASCNREIEFSHDFINQTLNNLQHDSIDTSGYQRYNIKTVLESALESYPYQENERELLHTDIAVDFDFWGSDVYVKNMFNNLLKNSFYYIAAARRGEIYITTLENEDNFIIQFKDTAQGAPIEVVEHMFDGYFSKRNGGTGLGLAFCKTVMESFNGFITAKSIEGEFIEFTLLFPKM
jgi:signal transduction histidine kinase